MDDQQRLFVAQKIFPIIQGLQCQTDDWVPFSALSIPFAEAGIRHKAYGCSKLRSFLSQFQDILEFQEETPEGKATVCYVRPRTEAVERFSLSQAFPVETELPEDQRPGFPAEDAQLFSWASVPAAQIRALAELALEEPWWFGSSLPQSQKEFPILRTYLAHTFRRLCYERKVRLATDPVRNEEYAAFNTGLVDQKFEPIYALFRHDTRYDTQYWYLLAFVVAGEDLGKKLVNLFNPLPIKADYFDGNLEKKLYNPSSGDFLCGYTHILTERLYRFPLAFLKEHCPPELLRVDGISIDDLYYVPYDSCKQEFFLKLGKQIRQQPRYFNRLRNQLELAVNIAFKRVKWNSDTAVPMYDPVKNQVFFLLPLSLNDETQVDLALVVERLVSGSYQGQTILSLDFAYKTGRTIAPVRSDWLRVDGITDQTTDSHEHQLLTFSKAVS